MKERKEETQSTATLPSYESHPPLWLPKIHGAADLGYVGFHPPRPGQDEDSLSENNVKNGFNLVQPVSVETFSAQAMINESLYVLGSLSKLEQLMSDVFIRRSDHIPSVPISTFKIPARVTLNDLKRQSWFTDLANPDVPLHKLGKSIPHGAKGHDLLDLLHSNNVAISRAVWFLRVFGANETAGLRNRPSYMPSQYSIDWANLVTGYMKKQLVEIALPSAPRPGLNIKQTFRGVLTDTDTRDRWISRFSYCLKLLRSFYAEDLVDHRTFLTWLVQQLSVCNLAQAGFLTRLADEFLDDVLASRALSKPLVEGCLTKLFEIRTTPARSYLTETEELLKFTLQRACLCLPDAFVSPRLWSSYSTLLEEILSENAMRRTNDGFVEQNTQDIDNVLSENFFNIKKRNEELLFRGPIPQVPARLGIAVSDVKLLNSISADSDIRSIVYFADNLDISSFKEKLNLLLTWSVTPLQYGDHRPFAAATLIYGWRNKARERANRRNIPTPDEVLQDQLFDWLDTSDVAGDANNIQNVALLFGKLVEHETFSYTSYIQRLIARGERGLSFAEECGSRHRSFLSWIPLFNSSPALINQRKVALHGVRARETIEDIHERELRKEIRSVLPNLFEDIVPSTSTATPLSQCKTLMLATRFEQVKTFNNWLLPIFKRRAFNTEVDRANLFNSYIVVVELMAFAKCFDSVLDLTLRLLEHSNDNNSMNSLINAFYRFAFIWAVMDAIPTIVKALDTAHQVWRSRGVQSRPLLELLLKIDHGQHLVESSRERITLDIASFTLALQPMVDQPDVVPNVLPEILLLANDSDFSASSFLANSLWIKYRSSLDWAWKVWDNTVASLRQIPSMISDQEARRNCALKYGSFLRHVDQHLPNGLDNDVLQWLLGPGKAEVMALSTDAWDLLKIVLIYLVVCGALKTTTILTGLIYPAWHLGATLPSSQNLLVETYLSFANTLCFYLMLQDDVSQDIIPPTNLFELQSLRTRREMVYNEPHFPMLVACIPALYSLESNENITEALRCQSTTLRCRICQESGFRRGAYRNLDIIREAIESSPYWIDQDSGTRLCKQTVACLNIILCDSNENGGRNFKQSKVTTKPLTIEANIYDWPEVTCLLSPWKIAATTIQMQLQVKQLGRALSLESTYESANANLNKLTSMLFHHTKTAEEAFYVGEMTRGADISVATKFINNGFQYMSELFYESDYNLENTNIISCFQRVGELLRILIHVSQPFRESAASRPSVDPVVHENLVGALLQKFTGLEQTIPCNDNIHTHHHLILLSRLIQFVLSFKIIWTSISKDTYANLSATIFRLALTCARRVNLDSNAYIILIDTLLVIYDEIPSDNKALIFDPYRFYPNIPVCDITNDIPPEYRGQIKSLIVETPQRSVITNLVNTSRDSQGNIIYGTSVVNKPWEWIENLGEQKEEEKEKGEKGRLKANYLVKNSGSISLEYFGARLSGDGVKHEMINNGTNTEGICRSFEDGMSENLFIRDWRETRMDAENLPEIRISDDLDLDALVNAEQNNLGTSRISPTPSVGSRSSTQVTTSSSRLRHQQTHSPSAQTNPSHREIIDVDNVSITSSINESNKRNASMAALSDDDIEIVEGPIRSVSAKKTKLTKGTTAGKTRAKKK